MDYSKLSKKQLIELVKKLESQQNNSTSFAKEKSLSFSVSNVVQTNKASDNEQKIIQNLRKLVSHLRTENKELSQEKEDLLNKRCPINCTIETHTFDGLALGPSV